MKEEIINTLKDLLSYKTYEENKKEFDGIFEYIKSKYNNLYISEYEFNGKKSIVLSNTDSKSFDIIFCGHVDVVHHDTYDYTEDNYNIYGRGTIDMKGSVAVLLEIIKNVKTNKKIAVFITSDEEIDGYCASMLSKMYDAKLAVIPDGGSDFELISDGHRPRVRRLRHLRYLPDHRCRHRYLRHREGRHHPGWPSGHRR